MESLALVYAHRLMAPRIAYLVGTRSEAGEADLIPVSNATSVSTDPQQVLIAVYRSFQTCHNLLTGQGFTLSVPRVSMAMGVWRLGARYSGLKVGSPREKLERSGVEIDESFSDFGPVAKDCLGYMECAICNIIDTAGDHVVFIGDVLRAMRGSEFDSRGQPVTELKPLMQVTGNRMTQPGDSFLLKALSNT